MKRLLSSLLFIAGVILMVIGAWRAVYPYGRRPGTVAGIYIILRTFATEHSGYFPDVKGDGFASLQSLYPGYCPTGRELAGISRSPERVAAALRSGEKLNQSVTSWRYVPGLRDSDDPTLALLWEDRAGLNSDGRRNLHGTRVVLLVGGDVTNVQQRAWAGFLRDQEQRRQTAKLRRNTTSKSTDNQPQRSSPQQ